MAEALGRFGAPANVVAAARTMTDILYLGVPPVRIDILRQRAAGRKQDLADVEILERFARSRST